jgi:hypothetical protein
MSPKAFKCVEKPIFLSQTFFLAIILSTYILQGIFFLKNLSKPFVDNENFRKKKKHLKF